MGLAAIGLYQPKTPANVGSVIRAAHVYSASMVAIAGRRYHRSGTDVSAGYRNLPLLQVDDLKSAIPFDAVPVAIELTEAGRSLFDYVHPKQAYYLFGPEDGSLPKELQAWCRDIIYIPTLFSMNLAATVNVVLYDRAKKIHDISKQFRGVRNV